MGAVQKYKMFVNRDGKMISFANKGLLLVYIVHVTECLFVWGDREVVELWKEETGEVVMKTL